MSSNHDKIITRALLVATLLNFLLAAIKIITGLHGNSLSLLGDGIDSGTDVLAGILSYFAARLVSKPANHAFPFGFNRAETLATWLAGCLIFMVGFQLILQSVMNLISQNNPSLPDLYLIYIIVISIISKLLISLVLFHYAKRTRSGLLNATAVNMKADILLGLSVLIGVGSSLYTHQSLYDYIFALLIGIWILKSAYDIFRESIVELMDGIEDEELYSKIHKAVDSVQPGLNPHRMRIRQMARKYLVSLDIEVDGSMNVNDGHKIAQLVEKAIATQLLDVYDVLVHVEPQGNVEEESFGVDARQARNFSADE